MLKRKGNSISLPDEKLRSIFQTRLVLIALCYSKHNKIHPKWRREIYYAQKHFPFKGDVFIFDGLKMGFISKPEDREYESPTEYAKLIDGTIKKPKAKKKGTKK